MIVAKLTSQKEIEDRIKAYEGELAVLAARNNTFVAEAQQKLNEMDQARQAFIETTQKQVGDNQADALRMEGTIRGLKELLGKKPEQNGAATAVPGRDIKPPNKKKTRA